MHFHTLGVRETIQATNSSEKVGLTASKIRQNTEKFGANILTEKKKKGLFGKVFDALKEPMLLILLFGLILTLGTNLGKFLKTGEADFTECIGIFLAITLSVFITIIMEGSSEKAFSALNRLYDNLTVKVIRDGEVVVISRRLIVVGDIILLESGDKIVADGRLIESEGLFVDESALTGESQNTFKSAQLTLPKETPLAERKNCVYSGTFVSSGMGKMVVTAVGDRTEIGGIAGELSEKNQTQSPLQQKLSKLGKIITILGAVTAIFVFIISAVRLAVEGNLTFNGIQDLFISCIVLIVAAVPEGLPTIVALSLALNMIKLASENALIKKMTATETAGAVSIICSDKTGTLTQNKMSVRCFYIGGKEVKPTSKISDFLLQNFVCNSTAEISLKNRKKLCIGSGTECALLSAYSDIQKDISYKEYRKTHPAIERLAFSSDRKYMVSTISHGGKIRYLMKGAGERVLDFCNLTDLQKQKIIADMMGYQKQSARIICFAHKDQETFGGFEEKGYIYDGFAVLTDPVRPEVLRAVNDCERAGIKIKMLTGDNMVTAFAVASELGIASNPNSVVNASTLENLDETALKKVLPSIRVIARSTPLIKLRVVRALQELGEIVAVTGDGINDAPAIKHADIGIAMGISGSEISKEAADIVLLDDSFATVVKAISFGRTVYKNLQRFILFQLSVNLSALIVVTFCAVFGYQTPFNTLQLLWINVIMDGPPALTLGLEGATKGQMNLKPVRREDSIVSLKMLFRIIFNGIFIGGIMIAQYLFNFLSALPKEEGSVFFTLFILFQLFNAFNSRELGADSIFKRLGKNKIMLITFALVFMLHIIIVQFLYGLFGIHPMRFLIWLNCILLASSVVVVSEIYKLVYRLTVGKNRLKTQKRVKLLGA